jgi:hypothetical protein
MKPRVGDTFKVKQTDGKMVKCTIFSYDEENDCFEVGRGKDYTWTISRKRFLDGTYELDPRPEYEGRYRIVDKGTHYESEYIGE